MTTDLEARLREMAKDICESYTGDGSHDPDEVDVGVGTVRGPAVECPGCQHVEAALREVAALAEKEQRERDAYITSALFRVVTGALDGDLDKVKAYAEHAATFLGEDSARRLRKMISGERGNIITLAAAIRATAPERSE